MTYNRKQNLLTYLKICITLTLICLLMFAGLVVDFGYTIALIYTLISDISVILIAISLFNFLQYDTFNFYIKEDLYNE